MPLDDEEQDIKNFEEQTTTEIAKAFDLQVTAAETLQKTATKIELLLGKFESILHTFSVRALKPLIYIVTGMVLIMVLQQLSLINRDEKVDQVDANVVLLDKDVKTMQTAAEAAKLASNEAKAASLEAKLASEAAKKSLDEAIAQSQRGGISPEVVAGLTRINEIYTTCVQNKEC